MSKEYIERGALLKDIEESVVFSVRNATSAEMRGANKIMECIKCATAADVVEVKHGKWEKDPTEIRGDGEIYDYRCSLCKGKAHKGEYGNCDVLTDYCPNCGAKMDLEV